MFAGDTNYLTDYSTGVSARDTNYFDDNISLVWPQAFTREELNNSSHDNINGFPNLNDARNSCDDDEFKNKIESTGSTNFFEFEDYPVNHIVSPTKTQDIVGFESIDIQSSKRSIVPESAGSTYLGLLNDFQESSFSEKEDLEDINRQSNQEFDNFTMVEKQSTSSMCSLLSGIHFCQNFKLLHSATKKTQILPLDKIIERCDVDLKEYIVTKLPLSPVKMEKLKNIDISKKRSLASCRTVIRGLALAEKWKELKSENLSNKQINNKFSNFQREDRKHGAGEKLFETFMKKHGLKEFDTYEDIGVKCNLSFGIFGYDGCMMYISSNVRNDITFFYENDNKLYLIKNLKGFCRIE